MRRGACWRFETVRAALLERERAPRNSVAALPLCGTGRPAGQPASRRAGFTLVEILVTIALLSFIVLGLFAMFNQVQRAFRSSMNQVDRLEAGRAVTEMLPRELEQMVPAGYPYPQYTYGFNFCVQVPSSIPLTQALPGTTVFRTNVLEDCFMLLRQNQTWVGIGYAVRTNSADGLTWLPDCAPNQMGVGSLYRFYASTNVVQSDGLPSDPTQLYRAFRAACFPGSPASVSLSNRICDGVIDFRFRAFATNGYPIFSTGSSTFAWFNIRTNIGGATYLIETPLRQAFTVPNTAYPDNLTGLYFYSNALPANVEMEFGILEQHAWERYNSIDSGPARLAYLQRPEVASRVHLFRQRIAIRNVDPLGYQ